MRIDLKKMMDKMFHTPRYFEDFCLALEEHPKATIINFRGRYYDWIWHVQFEELNLLVSSRDHRKSGLRMSLTYEALYPEKSTEYKYK